MGNVQYMAACRRGQFQDYHCTGVTLEEHFVVITCRRVIENYLKTQTKNKTLRAFRLFLLLPTIFLQYT